MRHPAGVEQGQQVAALGVIDPGDGGVLHAHPQVFAQANFKHNGHKSHKEIAMADQGDMVVGIAVPLDQGLPHPGRPGKALIAGFHRAMIPPAFVADGGGHGQGWETLLKPGPILAGLANFLAVGAVKIQAAALVQVLPQHRR